MNTAIDTSVLDGLGVSQKPVGKPKDALGQESFLKLMTTQLQNQDPFKPMENGDFLGQIAQFSTVSGIQDLQKSFETFASSQVPSQGLQAAGLINRNVLVPANVIPLNDAGMNAAVELPTQATQVNVQVFGAGGQLVHSFDLGALGEGITRYQWDGSLPDGSVAPAGQYKIAVDATVNGETIAVKSFANSQVESITFGNNGEEVNVNLRGIGSRKFSEILQIS